MRKWKRPRLGRLPRNAWQNEGQGVRRNIRPPTAPPVDGGRTGLPATSSAVAPLRCDMVRYRVERCLASRKFSSMAEARWIDGRFLPLGCFLDLMSTLRAAMSGTCQPRRPVMSAVLLLARGHGAYGASVSSGIPRFQEWIGPASSKTGFGIPQPRVMWTRGPYITRRLDRGCDNFVRRSPAPRRGA